MKIMHLVAGLIFLGSWLLPNHYMPWLGAYQDALALCALFMLALVTCWAIPNWHFSIFNAGLFILALLPIFQWLAGQVVFLGDALTASYYLLAFALALLLGSTLARSEYSELFVRCFFILLLLAAVLSTWIALRQWLLLSGSIWVADLPYDARPFANMAQPNNLATLLSLGLAAIWYLFEKHLLGRVASSVLAVFLLFGLVLTQSRTPWLAGLAIIAFWSWKYSCKETCLRLRPLVALYWYILFIALVLLLPLISEGLLLPNEDLVARATAASRLPMYKQFYLAILQGPIFGYGTLQTPAAQLAITPVFATKVLTAYSHNIVLDLFIWFGPAIAPLILVTAGFWLLQLARSATQPESMLALIMAGFIFIHSMLEYPHAYAVFLVPLGLILGVAQLEYGRQKTIRLTSKPVALLTCCMAALGSWIAYEYIVLEQDYRLMRFETLNIGTLKAEQAAPDVVLLTQLREYTRFARTQVSSGMDATELDSMRAVTYRFPYSSSLAHYAKALAYNGRHQEAAEHLVLLRKIHKPIFYQLAVEDLQQAALSDAKLLKVLEALEQLPEEDSSTTRDLL